MATTKKPYRARPGRPMWIALGMLSDEQKAELLGEWFLRLDKTGCWRAYHEDGRKTPLKNSFEAAQEDAINGRCVCPKWPWCSHGDVDWCCDQAEIIRSAGAR